MTKDKKRLIREYAEAIITALLLALVIRAFIIQAFKIPSGSMIPTLLIGDHILVNKFIYGTKIPFSDKSILAFKEPEKGDIIVLFNLGMALAAAQALPHGIYIAANGQLFDASRVRKNRELNRF